MKRIGRIEKIYGRSGSFSQILIMNFLILFIAWPIVMNVFVLVGFYAIIFPVSSFMGFNSNAAFDVAFQVIYWPWYNLIVSMPVLFMLTYYIRRKLRK